MSETATPQKPEALPPVASSAREKRRSAHYQIALLLFHDLLDDVGGRVREKIQWDAIDRHLKWAGKTRDDL